MIGRGASVALALAALLVSPRRAAAQPLRRPVACTNCIAGWYYFDHDPAAATQDWNCRTSTYNGHSGSDFSLRGGNASIATGYDVVAAADGVVIAVVDGNFDHCSGCDYARPDANCGINRANYVMIRHASVTTMYAHLRLGSVRVRNGQTVRCGDVLGQIGSSGCSTGAHLHFDTRPNGGRGTSRYDPFRGTCSPRASSLWRDQGSYRGLPDDRCDAAVIDAAVPREAGTDGGRDAGPNTDATRGDGGDGGGLADVTDEEIDPPDPGQMGLDVPGEADDAGASVAVGSDGCGCRTTAPAAGLRGYGALLLGALALRRRRNRQGSPAASRSRPARDLQ